MFAERLTQQLAKQPDFGPKTSLNQGGLRRAGAHFGPVLPPVSSHRTGSASRIGAPKEGEHAGSERRVAAEAAERAIDRGRRPCAGAFHAARHRLHPRRPGQTTDRCRAQLDRDDALQLQPSPPGRKSKGRHPFRRRHADGVQHHRRFGRCLDGHRRHEGLSGEPRGDRRFDRAGHPGSSLRRPGPDHGLRQDDSRRRHGAREDQYPRPGFIQRHDRRRPPSRPRHYLDGGFRSGRRGFRRQDESQRVA